MAEFFFSEINLQSVVADAVKDKLWKSRIYTYLEVEVAETFFLSEINIQLVVTDTVKDKFGKLRTDTYVEVEVEVRRSILLGPSINS